jgi:hypothetical protein
MLSPALWSPMRPRPQRAHLPDRTQEPSNQGGDVALINGTSLCGTQKRSMGGGMPRAHGESFQPQGPIDRSRKDQLVAAAAILLITLPGQLAAQSAEDDARDARIDAILATPNLATPVSQSNLIATAPGLEQQAPSAQFSLNFLAPFIYNSNAEEIGTGGTPTLEVSPVGNLSFAAPLLDLPVRLTANMIVENNRFIKSSNADLDKIGGSVRLQFVDPNNDQNWSPYLAYAPRWDFIPTFTNEVARREDENLGFNKRFNLDENFQILPFSGDTAASTVWSFGLTVFGQRRLREPAHSSSALFVIPSVSYSFPSIGMPALP